MFYFPFIIALILQIITLYVVIKRALILNNINKKILGINLVFIFSIVLLIIFLNNIQNNNTYLLLINIYNITITILTIIYLTYITDNRLNHDLYINKLLKALDYNNYFIILDKNNKIVNISDKLINKLNINDSLLNKNINYLLDKYLNIKTINNKEVSNLEFIKYLETNKDNDIKYELSITYLDKFGNLSAIKLNEEAITFNDKFEGRLFYSNIVTKDEQTITEKNYLDLIYNKLDTGLITYNFLTNKIEINNYLLNELNISNNYNIDSILSCINKEDFKILKDSINNTNSINNEFETTIEYTNNNLLTYLKLNCFIYYNGNNKEILLINTLISKSRQFYKTNYQLLDSIYSEDKIKVVLNELLQRHKDLELVTFKITNLKDLNMLYNRQASNLIIEEYLKTIKQLFNLKDNIFRLSGSKFCFIINDITKMELLTRLLQNNKLLSLDFSLGHIKGTLKTVYGISFSNDSIYRDEIYKNSIYALDNALKNNLSFQFFKNINN